MKKKRFIIFASGPSLTEQDVKFVKDNRDEDQELIVINDCYRIAPWAEYMYACDENWWNKHGTDVKENFSGECWTQDRKSAQKWELKLQEGIHADGLCSPRPNKNGKILIHFGSNSGYQAINLAYLWGAKEIMLLGYDMKKADNGKTHWFGDHPTGLNNNSPYTSFVQKFKKLADDLQKEGVKVVNCTRSTALNCFQKQQLEDYFKKS